MKVCRGCGGLSLKILVSNEQNFGCLPIGSSLIKLCYAQIADRCGFTQSGTEDLHQTELTSSSQFYLKAHKIDQFFP